MARTKAISLTFLALSLAVLFFAKISSAAIIFQDNLDAWPAPWDYSQTFPSPWLMEGGDQSATIDGVFHHAAEVTTGGRTGNSYKYWCNGNFPADAGYNLLMYSFTESYKEVYTRWYMKMASALTSYDPVYPYMKLWRFRWSPHAPDGAPPWHGQEVIVFYYYQFPDNARIFVGASDPSYLRGPIFYANGDDIWHCYEIRFKLNTPGVANGIIQTWKDGTLTFSDIEMDWGATVDSKIDSVGLGIGNRAGGTTFQNSWQAIEMDDYVLSTTPIGCTGPPSAYCGDLSCNGAETCSSCPGDCGACQTCGNNIREGSEACDGTDLAGQTCISRGFTGGTLACSSNCMSFDTSGCTSSTCPNGVCDSGESCSSCPQDCGQCTSQNLIAHWKLDEGLGTSAQDSSGNGNTGTLVNGPVWTTGKINGALSFDGTDDYVQSVSSIPISGSSARTVSVWFKLNNTLSSYASIVRWGTDSDTQLFEMLVSSGLVAHWWGGGNSAGGGSVTASQWYHGVMLYNGTTVMLYLNGIKVVEATDTINTASSVLTIGRKLYVDHVYFPGTIDDVRIYSRALNQSEVQVLYQNGTCIHKSDLDCNGCVSSLELTSFISRWYVSNMDVTLKELMEAMGFWKRGGC